MAAPGPAARAEGLAAGFVAAARVGGREDGIGTVLPAARPWWGYLWASFNSLVGLVGAASAGVRPVRWRGVLLFEGGRGGLAWVLRRNGFQAITLGHVIVTTERVGDRILAHELCHVTQHERWGPLFYPAYLVTSLAGYGRNPFEHQAERRAVEALARRHGAAPPAGGSA